MIGGLDHGQHLVERGEATERPVAASPQQHPADVERCPGAALDGGGDRLEPGVVMIEQLVDPRVAAGRDRPVRWQEPGIS